MYLGAADPLLVLLEEIVPHLSWNKAAKSSKLEFTGLPKLMTIPEFLSRVNTSKPPKPKCPSEEKYKSPESENRGKLSLKTVFTLGPIFKASPIFKPFSSFEMIGASYKSDLPKPPTISETKITFVPSGEITRSATEDSELFN